MKQINQVILQTSLHEMLRSVFNYAQDIYLNDNPETDASEIIRYVKAMENPKEFRRALITGDVCIAIYFDLGLIEKLTSSKTEFVVQVLNDDGTVWAALCEDELGSW